MRCNDFLRWYSDLRDGLIPERAVVRQLERHLRSCRQCARYDYAVSRGVGVLRLLGEIEPSPAFRRELRTRLARAVQGVPLTTPMRMPAAMAAAVLLAVAATLLLYEGMTARHERELAEAERAIPVVIVNPGVPFVSFERSAVTARPVVALPSSAPRLDTGWGTIAP